MSPSAQQLMPAPCRAPPVGAAGMHTAGEFDGTWLVSRPRDRSLPPGSHGSFT
jgi:hypothetical protein